MENKDYVNDLQLIPIDDDLTINKRGETFNRLFSHTMTASQLLSNDQETNYLPVKIRQVAGAIGGQVMLEENGDITFTPDPKFTGIMQFTYSISDVNDEYLIYWTKTGEERPIQAVVSLLTPDIPTNRFISKQWYLNAANIIPVWKDYTGKGILIGQFEPGVANYNHPDISHNMESTWLKSEEFQRSLADEHATMVAGMMVSAKDTADIIGVSPSAKLVSYSLFSEPTFLRVFGYMSHVDIANHSWGAKNFQSIWQNKYRLLSVQYAAKNGRGGLGTVIVGSAGNDREVGGNSQVSLVNASRFSIQVGAIDADEGSSISALGTPRFSNPGASILVSASGSHIPFPTHMRDIKADSHPINNPIIYKGGTSFAAPVISSTIALMLEANPYLGYRDVQHILLLSARRVNNNATVWEDNHARYWNGGAMHVSHDYGFGGVDAQAAVRLAETWLEKNTLENEWVAIGQAKDRVFLHQGKLASNITMPKGLKIEHAEITLNIFHENLSGLVVKLVSPMHTQSILLNYHGVDPDNLQTNKERNNFDLPSLAMCKLTKYLFMTTHDWGESTEGEWVLEVTDIRTDTVTFLSDWTLHLFGQQKTADDTYFYTDEYVELIKENPLRAILDDEIDGTKGGRNTFHAGAVSGNIYINLLAGKGEIGGQALSIDYPQEIQNIITGEGNDLLIANHKGALLDGGRGQNTLIGGEGRDIFVVHRRVGGVDTLLNFDINQGDKIHLVGFSAHQKETLELTYQGANTYLELQDGQGLVLKNQIIDLAVLKNAMVNQETLRVPTAYINSHSDQKELIDENNIVVLSGGFDGVLYNKEACTLSLLGTLYDRQHVKTNTFVVIPYLVEQKENIDYQNAVRGFKPDNDRIDLRQLGILSFDDLIIKQKGLLSFEDLGFPFIQGTHILSRSKGNENGPAVLMYLDGIMPSQIQSEHFILAESVLDTGKKIKLVDWESHVEASTDNLIQHMAAIDKSGILPVEANGYGSDIQRLDWAVSNESGPSPFSETR